MNIDEKDEINDTGMGAEMNKRYANLPKAKQLMDLLKIPRDNDYWSMISVVDLYDILMDEEKLRVLVAKLRNKAFW